MSKYLIVEEASGAIEDYADTLEEAKESADELSFPKGKYLVWDTEKEEVVYDTWPGVTFKI